MNNKKLFKGALVLFASILMAVSCSAGDKTGGNDNTDKEQGGGNTDTRTEIKKSDLEAAFTAAWNSPGTGVNKGVKVGDAEANVINISASKATLATTLDSGKTSLVFTITDETIDNGTTAKKTVLATSVKSLLEAGGALKTGLAAKGLNLTTPTGKFEATLTPDSSSKKKTATLNVVAAVDSKYKLSTTDFKDAGTIDKIQIVVILNGDANAEWQDQ